MTEPEQRDPEQEHRLNFSADYSVAAPATVQAMVVTHTDWNRVKTKIKKIVPATDWFKILGALAGGAALASGVNLWQATNPTDRFKFVNGFVLLVGLALCAALFAVDKAQRKYVQETTGSVIEEMDEIEGRATPKRDTNHSVARTANAPTSPANRGD